MTNELISPAAAAARESSRSSDGKFGTQPLGEADLDLLGHDAGQSLEYRRAAADQLASRLRAQAAAAEAYSDDLLIHEVALEIKADNPNAKTLKLTSDEHDMLEVELDGEYDEYATESLSGSSIVGRARSHDYLIGHGLSAGWTKVRYDDYELRGTIDLDIAATDPTPPLELIEAESRPFTDQERSLVGLAVNEVIAARQTEESSPRREKTADEFYALTLNRRPEETDTGHRVRALANREYGHTRADRPEYSSVWIPSRDTVNQEGYSGVDLIGADGRVYEGKVYGLTERIEGLEHLTGEELSASGIHDNGHGWHVPLG